MKDKFSKFINLQGKYLTSLLFALLLGIGQMWGAEIFGFTCTSSTTAVSSGGYTATGGTATLSGSAMSTGGTNELTIGTQTFYKFNSSSQWTFTLSSGKFAAGDVITFTCCCESGSDKSGKGVKINNSIAVTGDFPKNTTNTISYTVVASDGVAGQSSFYIKRNDSNIKFGTVSVTRSSGGGGDPVDPEFTYTPATYVIGDPALDLSTKLSSTNTTGAITFAIKDAAGTGASIANSKNFTATTAGTAKVTVSQEASTGYNAKSQDIDVTVAAPDPCTTYFHFVATADATANGKTNWDGFTNAPTGSNGQSNSVTIDGSNYTLTKRTGSTGGGGTILGFTIPANKAGTLYGYMKSSGSAARTLSLKKGEDVVKTNTEIVDGNWTLITIDAITPGTYTLSPDQNVQIQMFALKVCDATFHTITLDLDGGTGATSIQVLDGVPATKPADPTKDYADFAGWVVKSTSAAYDWDAAVTGDIELKATWNVWPTLTLKAGEGATGSDITSQHQAGSSVAVPAKPEGFSNGTKNFDGWTYSAAVTSIDETHFEMPASNLTLTAQWVSAASVARIGETEYATFAEALADHADGTIVLLQNVELDAMLSVNYDLAIDLNGNTLSRDDASAKLIEVYGDATLTITGTAENSEFVGRINLGRATNSNGNLVINGGYYRVDNGQTVLHVNGTCLASNVTITNATFVSPNDNAIQLNGAGVFNISNSTFTGKTGIYLKAGVLTLTACTVNGTGAYTDYTFYQNGSNPTGDAIVVDACGYPGAAPTINIVSGTYNSEHGSALAYYHPQGNPAVGGVTGGTFNSEVPAALCAQNYVPKDNGDGTYGVKPLAVTFDIEAYVVGDNTVDLDDVKNQLTAKGYAYSNLSGIDRGHSHNYIYDGLKWSNSNNGSISFTAEAGKLIVLKTGYMKASGAAVMSVNGVVDTETTIESANESVETHKLYYWYNADVANYSLAVNSKDANGTCVLKAITITDPYVVTFNANGGDDVAAVTFYGTALPLPNATKGTDSFKGWFDAATGGNKIGDAGDEYIPAGNVELFAQWEAISTDARLASITFSAAGTLEPAFNPELVDYTYTILYAPNAAIPQITGATAVNPNAKEPVIVQQASAWDETAIIRGVAQSDDTKAYNITMKIAPKDGVSIIKVATTGGTNKTVTGLYAGDGDVNLSSSKKMDGGKYIGFTLDGTTLQAGDRINVHTTQAANTGGSHIIFYDNMTDKNELYDTEEIGGTGDNIFTINAAMVGATTAYVYRSDADNPHKWNGYVDYIEVTRAMNPVLTAITLAGVTADKGTGDAFSATLPNGTNLASMTVVPTIVKNGEGGSAAPTAAWAWGDNTYRVTDKDGDYTDYTITLTEAATPSAAPEITSQPQGAEYLEGATIAALEVVATGSGELSYQWYLGENAIDGATAATYTPTVSAIGTYVYHCVVTNTEAGHPATSLVSSNATITIAEDPAAIKLLDGEGNVNTTDFITAVSKNTVNYGGADHNCATFGSTASTAVGASGLNKFIIYNAKTDQTKIKFVLYNTQNGAVTMKLQKLVEGGTEMVEEVINVPSKEEFTTDFYTFNGSANRTMYAFVQNTGIKVLQVKVIDNGTALKQFGEVGYSINFNQGRLFLNSGTDGAYDGLTYNAASNFAPLSSTGLSLTKNKAYRFNVPADATMTVTAANNSKYYITQTEDGEDNETAVAAATSFDLTAGTWYLRVAGSNLGVTNIAFAAPKCAEPVIDNNPESNTNFGQGNLTATVVAHATDGATLAYQWYDADDNEVAGATEATLTTTTEGTYYVIITASKAGYENRSVQSANATLGYRDNTIATLSALTYGTPATAIVLEADKYNYRVTLDEGTTDVPALAATATQAAYGATAVPTDATAFTDYKAVSTVLVTAEDGTTTQTYTVTFVVQHIYAVMEDVTESTTWNWSGSEEAVINDVANKGLIIANYIDGANFEMIEGKENERARRNQNGGVYQGTYLHFNTTVPGRVKFYFRAPSSGENCTITVKNGGRTVVAGTRGNSFGWSNEVFVNGDVVIEMENDKEGGGTTRVQQVVFTAAEADYTRDVTEGRYGTICLPNGGVMVGAALYEVAYFDASQKKIFFDEVLNGAMVAGTPYIFLPEENVTQLKVYYTDAANAAAGNANGLFGSYTKTELEQNAGNYILYNNQYLLVNSDDVYVGENRAYIKIGVEGGVPTNAVAPAPGRRRVAMGVLNEQVVTGVDELNAAEAPVKVMINGQMFILRGEKMYDTTGRLVK